MIECCDSLEFLKKKPDFENNIIYADPPYALGSEIMVREDGKLDYKKAVDFMNKWKMPDGRYWEEWFREAYRSLKHGGYLLMFGIDRQLSIFKYYSILAGFKERQSLYWYFISNMPKAADLSKNIDKHFKAEREVIGKRIHPTLKNIPNVKAKGYHVESLNSDKDMESWYITKPATELAQKYDGYKYSICPLKQTNETIMVFQKPYKSGSCLHDTLALENGDDECSCGALDIEGGRVDYEQGAYDIRHYTKEDCFQNLKPKESQFQVKEQPKGRYPAQTFIDSGIAEKLDEQSGILTSGALKSSYIRKNINTSGIYGKYKPTNMYDLASNSGGCSKILHKCDFEDGEQDLYFYESKVNKTERNEGLYAFDSKQTCKLPMRSKDKESKNQSLDGTNTHRNTKEKNIHPTLKPISLNRRILTLFKTPNEQKICFPFAGSGSEIIGGVQAGFKDYTACEINQEYIDIAEARIKYHIEIKPFIQVKNNQKDVKINDIKNSVDISELF